MADVRAVVVCDEGDWYAAGFTVLIPPPSANPEADADEYPGWTKAGRRSERDWLIEEKGYRVATESEVFVLWPK